MLFLSILNEMHWGVSRVSPWAERIPSLCLTSGNVPSTRNSYRYPQSAIRSDPNDFIGFGLTFHPIRQGADRLTIRLFFATNPITIRHVSDPQSESAIRSASNPIEPCVGYNPYPKSWLRIGFGST